MDEVPPVVSTPGPLDRWHLLWTLFGLYGIFGKIGKIHAYPFKFLDGMFQEGILNLCARRSNKSYPHLESPVKNTSEHIMLVSVAWLLFMSQPISHTNQDASNQHPAHHIATAGPGSLTLAAGCCELHRSWEAHLLAEPVENPHWGYNLCFCIVRALPLPQALGAWTFIDRALSWTGAEEVSSSKYQGAKEKGTRKVNIFKPDL